MVSEINIKPIYRQVADILTKEALGEHFAPGDRFYSEAELCERFGVTHVTIRNALRCLQEQGLVERVHGKGTFVRDRLEVRGAVGMPVWRDEEILHHPAFSELVRGASEILADRGYHLNLVFVNPDILEGGRLPALIASSRIDGLIMPLQQIHRDHLMPLRDKLKMVIVEQSMPDVTPYTISCDSEQGYYEATRHLIQLGHRRIGMVYFGGCESKTPEFLGGYSRAISEAGISLDPDLLRDGRSCCEPVGRDEAGVLLDLPEPPTAILNGDDFMALGAMRAAWDRGLTVPQDVSIVGCNGMSFAEKLNPRLTTVRIPYCELGRASAEMLTSILAQRKPTRENVVFEPKLVLRDSTCTLTPASTPAARA